MMYLCDFLEVGRGFYCLADFNKCTTSIRGPINQFFTGADVSCARFAQEQSTCTLSKNLTENLQYIFYFVLFFGQY